MAKSKKTKIAAEETKIAEDEKTKISKSTKYFPKDFIFDKTLTRQKEKKQVEIPIEEHTIFFGDKVPILFRKGKPVFSDELKIMSEYQINYYLVKMD